jgi:hypothetical protein
MTASKQTISRSGLVIGTLSGALLGAIISQIFVSAAREEGETTRPGFLQYVQLIIAIIILAKQAGDLLIGTPKKEKRGKKRRGGAADGGPQTADGRP